MSIRPWVTDPDQASSRRQDSTRPRNAATCSAVTPYSAKSSSSNRPMWASMSANCPASKLASGGVGEGAELVQVVSAAGDGGVDVEEVTGSCSVAQRVHLARHHVICMENEADLHLHGWLSSPVGHQLDPLRQLGMRRVGDAWRANVSSRRSTSTRYPSARYAAIISSTAEGKSARRCQSANMSTSSLGRDKMPWAAIACPPANANP